jgi:hypothetical protein
MVISDVNGLAISGYNHYLWPIGYSYRCGIRDGWGTGRLSSALGASWSGIPSRPLDTGSGFSDWSFEAELARVSAVRDTAESFENLARDIEYQRAQDAWVGNPDMTARQSDLGWYEGPHPDFPIQEEPVGGGWGWSPCM